GITRGDDSLAPAELLDPECEPLLRGRESRFLLADLAHLQLQRVELRERCMLALQRLACEILAPEAERLLRLVGPDWNALAQLPGLLLEQRFGRRHLDEASLDLDELALLLLVAVLEDLARVLGLVERGAELALRE